jgi:hypothetical protein
LANENKKKETKKKKEESEKKGYPPPFRSLNKLATVDRNGSFSVGTGYMPRHFEKLKMCLPALHRAYLAPLHPRSRWSLQRSLAVNRLSVARRHRYESFSAV